MRTHYYKVHILRNGNSMKSTDSNWTKVCYYYGTVWFYVDGFVGSEWVGWTTAEEIFDKSKL